MSLTRAQHLYKIASPGQRAYRLRQLQALVHAAMKWQPIETTPRAVET